MCMSEYGRHGEYGRRARLELLSVLHITAWLMRQICPEVWSDR